VDDLNTAIRESPVAAGLIGLGILFMFFSGRNVATLGSAARSLAGRVADASSTAGNAVAGGVSAASSQVATAAHTVGDELASGIHTGGTQVRDMLSAGYRAVTSEAVSGPLNDVATAMKGTVQNSTQSAMEYGTSLQRNLGALLERQPLVLGAIGLAIGAGIASAFPSTQVEGDFMGEASAAVKEKIQELASDTTELVSAKAEQVLADVKAEAKVQGLTTSTVKDAFNGAASKVKTIVGSARDSGMGRIS